MSKMSDFVADYVKRCYDDKLMEAWKSNANYSGFTGSVALDPLTKGIRKLFEDAYVPLNLKEKTFLEQVVEIEDE
mgnify:FL=1